MEEEEEEEEESVRGGRRRDLGDESQERGVRRGEESWYSIEKSSTHDCIE